LATALVAVHAFTAGGYSGDLPLAGYWALLLAAAGLSLVHGYALAPWRQRRRPFVVQSVDRVAARTWEVRLQPDRHRGGVPLRFRPGQFVWLKLGGGAFRAQEHPFSISTAPEQGPGLGFTIKEKGDFTDAIGRYAPGTRAYLDGPHGHFVPDEVPVATVYVAAGTGIGPVLSHLRAFRARGDRRSLRVIYAARTPDDLASRAELEALAGELTLTLLYVVQQPPADWTGRTGPIDRTLLDACLPAEGRRTARYFVCGSEPMMRHTARALRALGVPRGRIITGS
jgi:predicted ferric reductase